MQHWILLVAAVKVVAVYMINRPLMNFLHLLFLLLRNSLDLQSVSCSHLANVGFKTFVVFVCGNQSAATVKGKEADSTTPLQLHTHAHLFEHRFINSGSHMLKHWGYVTDMNMEINK